MNESLNEFNRRDFIKGGSLATVMTMLGGVELLAQTADAPAEAAPAGNKVRVAIITWQWGAYLGEENLAKGIHAKVDAFPERHGLSAEEIGRGLKAQKVEDVWAHVLARIDESHKLVGRCYELDRAGAFDEPTAESRKFILERCRAGAQLTADLWYTAWLRSATMPRHY